MAQLLDYLSGLKDDLSEGLGKIPPEVYVGVGAGAASGQPGAPLQGFLQGYAAHQQGLQAQEDRALERQQHDAKMAELDARLEGLKLDNDEKKAMATGRERLANVLKSNPGISPTDAFKLAALETGDETWLQKWGDAEAKETERQTLQEYRDAQLGISATNAATNERNSLANQQRAEAEFGAKQAEKARVLEQQGIDLDTGFEQQQRALDSQLELGDKLLNSEGFDRNFGLAGAIPNVPGWAGADAKALIDRFSSGELMQLVQSGAMQGVLSDSDIKIMMQASAVLADPKQSPEQARAALTEALAVMRKLKETGKATYERKRSTLGTQPAQPSQSGGTPAGASGGKTVTRAQVEATAQKRGMSVDQVLKDAAARGWKVLP